MTLRRHLRKLGFTLLALLVLFLYGNLAVHSFAEEGNIWLGYLAAGGVIFGATALRDIIREWHTEAVEAERLAILGRAVLKERQ